MKKYPSIPYWDKGQFGHFCYAFNKLDGSNIRIEWDNKLSKKSTRTFGFKKFGTRNQMIDNVNQNFGDSVGIFYNKYAELLNEIFRTDPKYRNSRRITIYLEYFGENSFAGQHEESDEKDIILFDVELFQKGFVDPKTFIDDFSHLGIPDIVYKGEYNKEFIDSVRKNDFGLIEGVVCKGSVDKKVWMVKIKTNNWLDIIKKRLGQEALNEELNGNLNLML